jgi:hypothetical protein
MKAKDSKAMLEVWEMKEHAYETLKHLSPEEQMKKIAELSSKLINEYNWQHKVSSKQNRNV